MRNGAKARASDILELLRREEYGWDEEVTSVCWVRVVERVQETSDENLDYELRKEDDEG